MVGKLGVRERREAAEVARGGDRCERGASRAYGHGQIIFVPCLADALQVIFRESVLGAAISWIESYPLGVKAN